MTSNFKRTPRRSRQLGTALGLVLALAGARFAAAQVVYGVAAMDKDTDALKVTIPAEQRVYQTLIDVREGPGGASEFNYSTQFGNGNNVAESYDPGPLFETLGMTVLSNPPVDPNDPLATASLSTRFNTGNSSVGAVHVDNVRTYDVTEGNRVINGGFENSANNLLDWRFFATNGTNGQWTLITDPNNVASGSQSLLLERLDTAGGSGLDLWGGDSLPVLAEEALYAYVTAKKDPAYASEDTRLRVAIQTFDIDQNFIGVPATFDFDIPDDEFTQVVVGPATLGSDVYYVSVGMQVMGPGGAKAVGGYFLDDVHISRNAPPLTGNILVAGDFENNFDGFGTGSDGFFDVNDAVTIDQWRFYALSGASGYVYPRSTAASSGSLGLELQRLNNLGDTAIDKAPFPATIPATERIYQLLVDTRDGGVYGGTDEFGIRLFVDTPAARTITIDPAAEYETWGLTETSPTTGQLNVRFFLPPFDGTRSVYFDNARVYDVTYDRNRMVNGGFENSDTRLPGWRFFAVGGATGAATLDSEAYAGDNAVLFERTNVDGDLGLDTHGDLRLIAGLPGETVQVSCMARTVSRVDGELRIELRTFDKGRVLIETVATQDFIPGDLAYELLDLGEITLPNDPNIGYLNLSFRISSENELRAGGVGSFLIDEVQIVGVDPATSTSNLLPNGDFEDDPAGTTVSGTDFGNDDTTFMDWRVFAIDGAEVSVTSTANAASSGSLGIEFVRGFGVCRDQDVDGSGFIDFADFEVFGGCMGGPGGMGAAPECTCFDQDGDEDNDLVDFANLQFNVSG